MEMFFENVFFKNVSGTNSQMASWMLRTVGSCPLFTANKKALRNPQGWKNLHTA